MFATSVFLAVLLAASVNAHLYLDNPPSMLGMYGSTGNPCGVSIDTSATVTSLEAGMPFALQFRANLHGTDPFSVKVSTDGGATFPTTIVSGLVYQVTATASTSYNGFQINLTAPMTTCNPCILQLSGMGTNGVGRWYNCANIKVVSPVCGKGFCTDSSQGTCNTKTNECECKKGYAGTNCNIAVSGSGNTVSYQMVLYVSKSDFNKDLFVQTLADNADIDADSITVTSIKSGGNDYTFDTTIVVIQLKDSSDSDSSTSSSQTAIEEGVILQTRYNNDQSLGPYNVIAFENVDSKSASSSGKKGSNAGAAAGATIGTLAAIGLMAGGYYYYKKTHA